MAFLTTQDYKSLIKDTTLLAVIESDTTNLGVAENMAQEEIESYLRERYDMAVAFSKSGTDRYPLLIMYMVDITLYHLHSRIASRQVPEEREKRYNRAIDWLERAQAGRVTANWAKLTSETTNEEASPMRWKSLPKFNSNDY
jgi:phage gp36-like protein